MREKNNIQEIINGCCKQRPNAQRQLVALYSDFLYAICCRYMQNRNTAKDQLQISLLKILKNIDQYNSEKGKLESWMSRITINTCLTDLRKNRINIVSIDDASLSSAEIPPEVIDQLKTKDLIELIQSLPDIYREIFNLVEIDGFSHHEIAEMLNIKVSSSRARLSRAKEMLRNKLIPLDKKKSWINLA